MTRRKSMDKRFADFNVKAEGNTYRITASTADIDRDGEVILPSSFKSSLPTYLKHNPVILYGHNWSAPPVGKATSGRVTDNALELDIEFAPTPFAQEIKTLYDGGFMNSFSVGFIPRDGQYDDEKGAFTYTECELLETSCVSIPSNRAATLMREAEDKGFSVSEIRKSLGIVDPETTEEAVPGVPEEGEETAKSPYIGVADKYLKEGN
jgi:HK97 family phage prohead protease